MPKHAKIPHRRRGLWSHELGTDYPITIYQYARVSDLEEVFEAYAELYQASLTDDQLANARRKLVTKQNIAVFGRLVENPELLPSDPEPMSEPILAATILVQLVLFFEERRQMRFDSYDEVVLVARDRTMKAEQHLLAPDPD